MPPIAQSSVDFARPSGTGLRLATELVCYVGKGRVGTAADRGDRAQANDDDQSQHHSVFNCCRAVFGLQETIDLRGEILHGISPIDVCPAIGRAQGTRNNKHAKLWNTGFAIASELSPE